MPAKILALPGERDTTVGEYWRYKYLCLVPQVVSFVRVLAIIAGEILASPWSPPIYPSFSFPEAISLAP